MKEIDLNEIIENLEPDADITHEYWNLHRRLMREAISQALDMAAEEATPLPRTPEDIRRRILRIKDRIK